MSDDIGFEIGQALRALVCTAAIVGLVACADGDDDGAEEESDAAVALDSTTPAPEPVREPAATPARPAATLRPGMTWQWQLQDGIDTSHDVDVYDVDLFDTSSEVVERLRRDGRVVICYFSTAFEDWRADAATFRSADLGEPLDDWDGERWVDIRSDSVRVTLAARLDRAAALGCDGVEPDNVTAYRNDSGFDLTADDQLDFNRFLAAEAHERGLLVGLKNDLEQIPELVDDFDFAVNEQCVQYDECDVYAPFVSAGKPVFGAEYSDDAIADPARACAAATDAGVATVILPLELDGSFRIPCP